MLNYPKKPCKNNASCLKIRPHHGLCAEFFCGEGYSGEFVENMSETLSMLNLTDPIVTLTEGADMICVKCPHNAENGCETDDKVSRYDGAVLSICGLSAGDSLGWLDFRNTVKEKIIAVNRLPEICSDCNWYGICSK